MSASALDVDTPPLSSGTREGAQEPAVTETPIMVEGNDDNLGQNVTQEPQGPHLVQEHAHEPWWKRVKSRCKALWALWMLLPLWFRFFLVILPACLAASAVMIVTVDKSQENTGDWIVSSALVTSVTVGEFCVRRWRCSNPPQNHLYRVEFGIKDYSVPGFSLAPDASGLAYWGTSPGYQLEYDEAVEVEAMFESGERYVVWVHPDDPTRVSMTGEAEESNEILYIFFIVVTVLLGLLLIVSIVSAVKLIRTNLELERIAEDAVREGELVQKSNISRRKLLAAALQEVCVVPSADRAEAIRSRGEEDCPICLETMLGDEENAQEIMLLPCSHLFHSECIVNWVMVGRNRACPLCHAHLRSAMQLAVEKRTADSTTEVAESIAQ